MVRYEIKKNIHIFTIVFLLFSVLLELVSVRMDLAGIDMDNRDEKYYLEYIEKWQGTLTESKEDEILYEKDYIDLILSQEEDKKNAYLRDEITKEAYDSYIEELTYCRQRVGAFQRLYADYQYVKDEMERNKENAVPEIFYKEYWKKLLSPNGYDYFAMIFFVFFSISMAFVEKDNLMKLILYSSERGRYHVLKSKLQACAIVVGILSIVISLIKSAAYFNIGYFPNSSASIVSLESYSGSIFHISLGALFIIGIIGRSLFSIMISQIIILLSNIICKKMTMIAIVAVALFGMEFLQDTLPMLYAYMPASFVNVFHLIAYAARGSNIIIQILMAISVICIYVAMENILRMSCRKKMKF